MNIERLEDLREYLLRAKFPGDKFVLRIRRQFGNINLSENAKNIACRGGLGVKEERQQFYGLVVAGQGRPSSHFSGKEKCVFEECERLFEHHSR